MYSDEYYNYDYENVADATSAVGGIMAFTLVYTIIALALSVLMLVAMMKLFKKFGKPMWAAIVPIYNAWVLFEIAGLQPWLCLIPFVNVIIIFVAYIKIAQKLGKSTGFIILSLFFMPICLLIMAFGKAMPINKEQTKTDETINSNVPEPMKQYVNDSENNNTPVAEAVPTPINTPSSISTPIAPSESIVPSSIETTPATPVETIVPESLSTKPQEDSSRFFNNVNKTEETATPEVNNNVQIPIVDVFNSAPTIPITPAAPEASVETVQTDIPVVPEVAKEPVTSVEPQQVSPAQPVTSVEPQQVVSAQPVTPTTSQVMPKTCPKCNASLDGSAQFCFMCGEKF